MVSGGEEDEKRFQVLSAQQQRQEQLVYQEMADAMIRNKKPRKPWCPAAAKPGERLHACLTGWLAIVWLA